MKFKKTAILFILIVCSLLFSTGVYAGTGSQYLFTGGFPASNIADLRYVLSGGDSSYQQNIMVAGANQWNGISSMVSVSLNSLGATVSIYKSTTSQQGLMGYTYLYYRNWLNQLVVDYSTNNIWECVDAYGYDNQMEAAGYGTLSKKAVFTHEMGHALSLAHNDANAYAIMTQGSVYFSPQNDDKVNLKLKWGN